jgi:hypothetical protein
MQQPLNNTGMLALTLQGTVLERRLFYIPSYKIYGAVSDPAQLTTGGTCSSMTIIRTACMRQGGDRQQRQGC